MDTATLDHPRLAAQQRGELRGSERPRLAWIDVARGFVVLTVVLMHVGLYHYLPLVQGGHPGAHAFWTSVSATLDVVRMPTLLVLSGWLASSQIKRGLGDGKTRKRVATNAWLYALWLCLYAAIAVLLDGGGMAQAVTPDQIMRQLLVPYSTLWFLAALVWYVLFFSVLRRLPTALVMAAALAISACSWAAWPVELGLWVCLPHYLVFFGVGVHFKDAVASLAERPLRAIGGGAALVWLGSMLSEHLTHLETSAYAGVLMTSLGSLGVVLGAASLLTRWTNPVERVLAGVGRRTVSVYVLHYPMLMALTVAEAGPLYDWPRDALVETVGSWCYPLVATAVTASLALAVHASADRVGLGWLFRLPRLRLHPTLHVARVPLVWAGWQVTTAPFENRAQLGGR